MENTEMRNLAKLMGEKRAITLGGTGAVTVVPEIVRAMVNKYDLFKKFRIVYGPSASSIIPVLSPGMAVPVGAAESATAVTGADSTAVFGATTLTPKLYMSSLPVSAEALLMSGADVEAMLPEAFADAFGQALLNGALVGVGSANAMTGLFLTASAAKSVSCAAAGAPKLVDLVKLASEIKNYTDNGIIIVNGTYVAAALAESGSSLEAIKNEILVRGTIRGVPVFETAVAPTTVTASSSVAVALDPRNYAIGIAQELVITPKSAPGVAGTYFDATMFIDGKPVPSANVIKLVTV